MYGETFYGLNTVHHQLKWSKKQKLVREKKAIDEEKQKLNKSEARLTEL